MPEILPHEVAEIAIRAYEAQGFKVARVGAGGPSGAFATYHVQTSDGSQTFTIKVEEVW